MLKVAGASGEFFCSVPFLFGDFGGRIATGVDAETEPGLGDAKSGASVTEMRLARLRICFGVRLFTRLERSCGFFGSF